MEERRPSKEFWGTKTRTPRLSHRQSLTSATGFLSRGREHFWSREGSSEEVALGLNRILTVDTEDAGKRGVTLQVSQDAV